MSNLLSWFLYTKVSLKNFPLAIVVHLIVHSHVISITSVVINKALKTMYEIQTYAIYLSNSKNAGKPSLKDTENT